MAAWSIRPGFTFRFNDRLGDDHLYVVISRTDRPHVVIANLTSRSRWSDASCVIQPGEHRFVVRETVIAYNYAKLLPVEALEEQLSLGELSPHDPFSEELLFRMLDGAGRTKLMPLNCVQVLREQGLI